jgi:hypothetical protein
MRTGYDGELSSHRETSLAEWRRHNDHCWRVGNLRRCGVQPTLRYSAASLLRTGWARKTPRDSSSLNTAHWNRKLQRGTNRYEDVARRNVELRRVRGQIVVEMKTQFKFLPRVVLGERVKPQRINTCERRLIQCHISRGYFDLLALDRTVTLNCELYRNSSLLLRRRIGRCRHQAVPIFAHALHNFGQVGCKVYSSRLAKNFRWLQLPRFGRARVRLNGLSQGSPGGGLLLDCLRPARLAEKNTGRGQHENRNNFCFVYRRNLPSKGS